MAQTNLGDMLFLIRGSCVQHVFIHVKSSDFLLAAGAADFAAPGR